MVLFRPDEGVVPRIENVLSQFDKLLLFVNKAEALSPSIRERIDAWAADKSVDVTYRDDNVGLSDNYALAIDRASSLGHPYLCLFDQDTTISPGFRETIESEMVRLIEEGKNPGIVGGLDPEGTETGTFEVKKRISSGSLLRVSAAVQLLPLPDLFLDNVDFDLCIRLRRLGYTVWNCAEAKMRHSVGYEIAIRKFLGKDIIQSNYPPFRLYFVVRNAIWFRRTFVEFDATESRSVRNYGFAVALAAVLYERPKLQKCNFVLRGFVDGIRSKSEKVSTKLMPRL